MKQHPLTPEFSTHGRCGESVIMKKIDPKKQHPLTPDFSTHGRCGESRKVDPKKWVADGTTVIGEPKNPQEPKQPSIEPKWRHICLSMQGKSVACHIDGKKKPLPYPIDIDFWEDMDKEKQELRVKLPKVSIDPKAFEVMCEKFFLRGKCLIHGQVSRKELRSALKIYLKGAK